MVRQAVARNKNTPIYTLEKLANDPDDWVRRNVDRNSKMQSE